jgi:hypothetical protein
MTEAEVLVRLKAETAEYQRKMAEAKEQAKLFGDVKKGLVGTMAKFAGAVGGTVGLMESFKKIMSSNRIMSKEYAIAMAEAKSSVDTFFNALSMGDFSIFTDSMNEAIASAKEFQIELGRLATMQVFQSNEQKKLQVKMADARIIIANKKSTAAEKAQARKDLAAYNDEYLRLSMRLGNQAQNTYKADLRNLLKSYGAKGSNSSLNNAIDYYFGGYDSYEAAKKRFEYLESKANSLKTKVNVSGAGGSTYGGAIGYSKMVDTKESLAITDTQEYKVLRAIYQLGRDRLNDAKQLEGVSLDAELNAKQIIQGNLRRMGAGLSSGGGGSKNVKADTKTAVEGSISYYEQQIGRLNEDFKNAADDRTRLFIQNKIDELNKLIENMNEVSEYSKQLGGYSASGVNGLIPKGAKNPATELEDAGGALDKIKATFGSKGKSDTATYNDNLNTIANTINNIGEGIGGGAAAWLKWGANMASAIGTAIPLVTALTAVKKDEMHTDVVDAGATAAKSAAATPIIGWIAAIGAIAAVFASLAAAPKFANGGIFDGKYSMGDKMYARVNAGELILNRAQQRNIASQLTTIPNSLRNGQNIIVTGKVSGRDLLFAIDKNRRHYSRT